MVTLRIGRKLATLNKENYEEHSRSKLAQNSIAARSEEDHITQISEEIQNRVTKNLSQEISRTESHSSCALFHLDDFPLNLVVQGHSGTGTETSGDAYGTNQGTNEDHSQSDFHLEASIFQSQMTRSSGLEEAHDMMTRVHEDAT